MNIRGTSLMYRIVWVNSPINSHWALVNTEVMANSVTRAMEVIETNIP